MLEIVDISIYKPHTDPHGEGMVTLEHEKSSIAIPFSTEWPESGRDVSKPPNTAGWNWDGDEDSPTLSPSIDIDDIHIFIENGEIQHCRDCKCGDC